MNAAARAGAVHNKAIGSIIRELRDLSADQIEQILDYQRRNHLRFGEAAVALQLASADDVLEALSRQFHYPYVTESGHQRPELVALTRPFSAQAESFRALRSQLMLRIYGSRETRRAVAVVSAEPGAGKTFVAANLAVTLAQLGGRTLLVDADMRNPRLHEVFQIDNTTGLSAILSGRTEHKAVQQIDDIPALFVVAVGATPPNPLELIERPAFGLLMNELVAKFDHVIVDTPAVARGTDATVIAARCGAAIVVARRNESRLGPLRTLVHALQDNVEKVLGVAFNDH
ncbi:MAG: polysaccharide biosynthesis tyrosine autokinase [Rubrivivax sp.]